MRVLNEIDSLIMLIRTSESMDEATSLLRARGLDEVQSKYILSFPMRLLPELENAAVIISKCEQMLRLIQEIGE